MPDFCAAYGCTNARSLQTRTRGITFHKFPKCSERRRQWERALRREGFVANDRTVLCSEHFRNEDFDRTGQTIRIKAGAVPTVFNFPAHLQRVRAGAQLPSAREPVAPRSTNASRKAGENQPMYPEQDQPPPDVPQPSTRERQRSRKRKAPDHRYVYAPDHQYAMPSSPKALKAKLDAAMATVRKMWREKSNALARVRRAKKNMKALLEEVQTI